MALTERKISIKDILQAKLRSAKIYEGKRRLIGVESPIEGDTNFYSEVYIKAIEELEIMEEALQPKTCDGCVYKEHQIYLNDSITFCDTCSRKAIDYYEPKEGSR